MKYLKISGDGATARAGYNRLWITEAEVAPPWWLASAGDHPSYDGTGQRFPSTEEGWHGWSHHFLEGSDKHKAAIATVSKHNETVARRSRSDMNPAFGLAR